MDSPSQRRADKHSTVFHTDISKSRYNGDCCHAFFFYRACIA